MRTTTTPRKTSKLFSFYPQAFRDRKHQPTTEAQIQNGRSSRSYQETKQGSKRYAVGRMTGYSHGRPSDECIGELVASLRDTISKSPAYVARLGNIDPNKGKVLIDLKFPDGPPPEYERPGIELTEELEWRKATRPVEHAHHQRLDQLLYPTGASTAIYQDTKRRVSLTWNSLKTYMGWEGTPQAGTAQDVVQRVFANPPVTTSSGASTPTPSPAPSSPTKEVSQQSTASASPGETRTKDAGFMLPDPKSLTLDLNQFRSDLRRASKPQHMYGPRGTFAVIGLVEVWGDRARVTLNVTAFYDPKQGRYVALQGRVWNLVSLRQSPRGGP